MGVFSERFIAGRADLRRRSIGPSAVTIGAFDGVHCGHRQLISALAQTAAADNLRACVVTFEPLPSEYFAQSQAPSRIMNLRTKVAALLDAGADTVVCLHFNQALAQLSATDFVQQLLVKDLNTRHLWVGDDFRFGRGREGDISHLHTLASKGGFYVEATHTHCAGESRISSTRIRQQLNNYQLEEAARLLGQAYHVIGRVGCGRQLGRSLDVPTANLAFGPYPSALQGVFAVRVQRPHSTDWLPAVANLGTQPSLPGRLRPRLEVHLLDFKGDLYGEILRVRFDHFLRPTQAFPHLTALQQQLQADIAAARRYFNSGANPAAGCNLNPLLPLSAQP